jgi:hypothetical protein
MTTAVLERIGVFKFQALFQSSLYARESQNWRPGSERLVPLLSRIIEAAFLASIVLIDAIVRIIRLREHPVIIVIFVQLRRSDRTLNFPDRLPSFSIF